MVVSDHKLLLTSAWFHLVTGGCPICSIRYYLTKISHLKLISRVVYSLIVYFFPFAKKPEKPSDSLQLFHELVDQLNKKLQGFQVKFLALQQRSSVLNLLFAFPLIILCSGNHFRALVRRRTRCASLSIGWKNEDKEIPSWLQTELRHASKRSVEELTAFSELEILNETTTSCLTLPRKGGPSSSWQENKNAFFSERHREYQCQKFSQLYVEI